MDIALVITLFLALLAMAGCFVGGSIWGHRRGRLAGFNDALRQLLRAKDEQCWIGARYLEMDTFMEAETERIERRRK